MKLTAKLVFLVTSGFIIILLVDSYFLVQREKELIETGNLHYQFELIQTTLPLLKDSGHPEKFSLMNEETFNSSLKLYNEYDFKNEKFWILQDNKYLNIRYKSKDNVFLEYQTAITTARTITDIYKRTITVIIITILISFLFTSFIGVSIIGKPVKKILNKIDQIKSKNYADHVSLNSKDELADIAHSLNEMASEIEQAYLKKLEYIKQLRHAERLTTIGALTSGIAHELGTPLNVILGHCSFIRCQSESEKNTNSLNTIQKQVDKMSTLIKNLLSFSQKSNLMKEINDLDLILKECVQLLEHKLKGKGISVSLTTKPNCIINCDKQKIEQVIINILMNSFQALNQSGSIKISCNSTIKRTFKNKKRLFYMLSIGDNGPGIKQEDIDKIFDPFFTTKDIGEGTGLGLSISMGIIEEHDGWIEVDSVVGEGAVFYIYLPVLEEQNES